LLYCKETLAGVSKCLDFKIFWESFVWVAFIESRTRGLGRRKTVVICEAFKIILIMNNYSFIINK